MTNYIISGKVVQGDQYGKKLGYPTANIDRRQYSWRKMKIRFGIYAGFVQILNLKSKILNHKAGIVIGPLDKHRLPKIEAHLIGFKGNLYGKRITVSLKKYLRPFAKYKTIEELKKQIAADIKKIKLIIK